MWCYQEFYYSEIKNDDDIFALAKILSLIYSSKHENRKNTLRNILNKSLIFFFNFCSKTSKTFNPVYLTVMTQSRQRLIRKRLRLFNKLD